MVIRMLIIGCGLAACTPTADPTPTFPLNGPAADTSFKSGAQEVAAEVALSTHLDNIK